MNCHALTGTRTKSTRLCFSLLFLRSCHWIMHLLDGMTFFLLYHEINLHDLRMIIIYISKLCEFLTTLKLIIKIHLNVSLNPLKDR